MLSQRWYNFRIVTRLGEKKYSVYYLLWIFLEKEGQGTHNELAVRPLKWLLKPSQNKMGQKIFRLHRFLNTFSQLPAVKKYSKNGAAGKFFGPSYFDPALPIKT